MVLQSNASVHPTARARLRCSSSVGTAVPAAWREHARRCRRRVVGWAPSFSGEGGLVGGPARAPGQRADLLADGLADLLRDPLADPFAQELVLVPARGVERWLSQRLSHRLGAGPGRRGRCLRGCRLPLAGQPGRRGHRRRRDDDPWSPDAAGVAAARGRRRARRRAVVPRARRPPRPRRSTGEEGELRRGRRYAVARRLAGLFASYAVQRPSCSPTGRPAGHRRRR